MQTGDAAKEPHSAPPYSSQSSSPQSVLPALPALLTLLLSSAEVAIPRLPRTERSPAEHSRHRDRVTRACCNCHRRKVKCSGGLPRCDFCEKINKPCVYEATRKNRLAAATDRNERLESLLRILSGRVDGQDRARIENVLNNSKGDYEQPEPSSAGQSTRFPVTPYAQSDASQYQSCSRASPVPTPSTPGTEDASSTFDTRFPPGQQDMADGLLASLGDVAHAPRVFETIYMGQICEAQWLRNLKARIQIPDAQSSASTPCLAETNYYLDNDSVLLLHQDNPFHLPPENVATVLLQCYLRTVHVTFPLAPEELENQLHMYYDSMRTGHAVAFEQRWYGIVNVVLRIGAQFSHLVSTDWRGQSPDEALFLSRACQLLELDNPTVSTTVPDLSLIQASGLLAFHYMATGHVNRAWILIGTALRLAMASGLHTYSQSLHADPSRKQAITQIWWSIHNLESLLSSMTGKPSMVRSDEITIPLPSAVLHHPSSHEPHQAKILSIPDVQVQLAAITQEVQMQLYTERRKLGTSAQTHAIITSLLSKLDSSITCIPHLNDQNPLPPTNHSSQLLILKFQYYRVKILITCPCLLLLERSSSSSPHNEPLSPFDHHIATTCIQTAQQVASLLPQTPNLKTLYENTPWWSLVHNIMLPITILLLCILHPTHFPSTHASSISSIRHLAACLRAMRGTNDMARRAYLVLLGIVRAPRLREPALWADVVDAFPVEELGWVGEEEGGIWGM